MKTSIDFSNGLFYGKSFLTICAIYGTTVVFGGAVFTITVLVCNIYTHLF